MKETVGRRIRRLREEAGLSQRQLADGLPKVSPAFVSRIEHDERGASEATLRRIAERLGTTAAELEGNRGTCPHCGGKL